MLTPPGLLNAAVAIAWLTTRLETRQPRSCCDERTYRRAILSCAPTALAILPYRLSQVCTSRFLCCFTHMIHRAIRVIHVRVEEPLTASTTTVAGRPFCYDRGSTLQTLVDSMAACDGKNLLLHFPHKPLRGVVPVKPQKGRVLASIPHTVVRLHRSCAARAQVNCKQQGRYFS